MSMGNFIRNRKWVATCRSNKIPAGKPLATIRLKSRSRHYAAENTTKLLPLFCRRLDLVTIVMVMLLPVLVGHLLVNTANGQNSNVVSAFKHYLDSPPQVREIKFAIISNGQNFPAYYFGRSQGTNFFVRKYLPTENVYTSISPTNFAPFPFFGRVAAKQWEIAGLNVYQTEDISNPISLLVSNASYILDQALSLGLFNVSPGTVVWTNGNQFVAKRGGLIPDRVEVHYAINGVQKVKFLDPSTVSGSLYISNGIPSRMDCDHVSFYFNFRPADGLPIGIPSIVSVAAFGLPKSKADIEMSIISYKPDKHLKTQDFEPDQFVSKDYIGIFNRANGREIPVKDNAYAISTYETESHFKNNSTKFLTARIVLIACAVTPILLAVTLYLRKKSKPNV